MLLRTDTSEPDPSLEESLFEAALAKPTEAERAAFLNHACRDNPALRARLELLLEGHFKAEGFLGANPGKGDGTVALPAQDVAGSTIIGRYKLLERIGEGGFGEVWMVEQTEPVKRRVALKIIKLGMDTKQVVARFEAERQALAMMDHPNIAKVLDAGATDTGRPYFVMELVRGVRITQYCDQNQLPTRERLKLFIQVCQAIQHAHQKGIIHRDIKPSNILVTLHDGVPVPKVIDFGIAKATQMELTEKTVFTQFRQFLGTPAYISPEQAEMSGLDVDTRSDIYSLGVLLYELLTGQTPFDTHQLLAAGLDELRRTIREQQPARPSTRLNTMARADLTTTAQRRGADPPRLISQLRGDLDSIVMKCLEKDRNRRYETANGLARDLERHLNNEPVLARSPSRLYEFQKTVRRHWVGFTAATAVIAALAGGVVVSTLEAARASRAETLAKQRLAKSDAYFKFLAEVFHRSDAAIDSHTVTVAEALGAAGRKLDVDLADQPALLAEVQATLAWTYGAMGLEREAIPLREKVRDYYFTSAGPQHPDTIEAISDLASSYSRAGQSDEALKLLEQVLRVRRKVNGPEHPDTLKAMFNLAFSYAHAGRWGEAQNLLEQSLALRRKVNGPEHPETLRVTLWLALAYDHAGRQGEAQQMIEQVVALRRKVLGPEHPDTIVAMIYLAHSYDRTGRQDEALQLWEQALALRRKVNGPEHPDTLNAMFNLAYDYAHAGRWSDAMGLLEQEVALQGKVNGLEHADTLRAMLWLAFSYDQLGHHGEAQRLMEQVVALRRELLGPDHPDTLVAMSALAAANDRADHRDEVLKLRAQALALQRQLKGPEHPDTLGAMFALAEAYDRSGRRGEALELWQQVLALRLKVLGPEHPDTLETLNTVAWSLATCEASELRNGTEAVQLAERAVAGSHRANPMFLDTLAAAYAEAQQFDQAVAVQQQAIGLLRSEQDKTNYTSRLKLYQANQPFREQIAP